VKRLLALGAASIFLAAPAFSQSAATTTPLPSTPEQALAVAGLKNAIVGVLVQSLDTGKVLFERNPDIALMPASNQKILTSATALHVLGVDYRFKTTLSSTGTLGSDGTLHGDLILTGSGDPSFAYKDLQEMAKAAKKAGIRRVEGAIITDASAFDDQLLGEGWQWDDEPYTYQPQVAGLNCDENIINLTIRPGKKPGDAVIVQVDGGDRYLQVSNTATTAEPKQGSLRVTRARALNIAVVSGALGSDSKPVQDTLTVEDPAHFTGERLREALAGENISVDKPTVAGTTPTTVTSISEHLSEPLGVLLRHFLKASDNLYGETLLKAAGAKFTSSPGSANGGEKALRALLTEAQIDPSGLSLADGSGLSRNDNITPRLLVALLTYVDRSFSADNKKAFWEGLPVGGVDGTLRNRFKETPLQKNLRAKTGSLSGVSSLSGYMTTKSGERLVFSMLMNNFSGGASVARGAQDALARVLYDLPRSGQ
jgi:D-alanyl-D-alanine carboxypeptidase/D-alanyl-D-alanine-endopeptidase (penicillin-binding protein 4)